jgi:hypothetical protein
VFIQKPRFTWMAWMNNEIFFGRMR